MSVDNETNSLDKCTEIERDVIENSQKIGDLNQLNTSNKSSLVEAINELLILIGKGITPPVESVPVTEVQISEAFYGFTSFTTHKLNVTVLPLNATDKNVIWKSSDKNVVMVSDAGLITAKGNGMATITATSIDGNKTAMCSVVVNVQLPPPSTDKTKYRSVAYAVKPWDMNSYKYGIKQYEGYDYGSALLCLPIDNKFDTDEPVCGLTDDQINEACDLAEEKGLEVVLKCHNVSLYQDGQGNRDRPSDAQKWFSNYKQIVDRIADISVSRGYDKIIISNEMHNVLNIALWKNYFITIINSAKAKGLKVSCSTNIPEIRENDGFQYWNEIDFFSVNTYPQLTDQGKEWAKANYEELKNNFYIAISPMDVDYGELFKNLGGPNNAHKDIWITELGCIPTTTGLLYPAFWGSGQTRDEEVQKIFMSAVMDIMENDQINGKLTNRLSRYVLWDGNSDSDFNMVGKQSQAVLDEYWGNGAPLPPEDEMISIIPQDYTAKVGDVSIEIPGTTKVDPSLVESYEADVPGMSNGWIGVVSYSEGVFTIDISWIQWASRYENAVIFAKDKYGNRIAESVDTFNLTIM